MSSFPLGRNPLSRTTSVILIVDADAFVRRTIRASLESPGYQVIEVETTNEALALARQRQVDAFILDMQMPGPGGAALCRTLRGMDAYRITPILFITRGDEHDHAAAAFAAGC